MAVTQGSIGFVGINTNGTDWVAFVTLADLVAGDTIYFTDNELLTTTSTSFNTGESYTKWVAPAGGVVAGTVVVLNSFDTTVAATTGTASAVTFAASANRGLSATADNIIAYTAASDATVDTPTLILTRINIGNAEDGAAPASVPANNQITFTSGADSAYFSGSHSGQASFAAYLPIVNTPAGWTTVALASLSSVVDATPFTITQPAQVTVNDVSMVEGNAGTSLLTFTITRSNNAGAFTLDVATADQTASAGIDYTARSANIGFTAGGALSQTFSITVNGDTTIEGNETLLLNLSNLVSTAGSASITDAQGQGTIFNDDSSVSMLSAGDVDRDSAVLLAKTTALGPVTFQVATDAAFTTIIATQQSIAVTDPLVPAKVFLADGTLAAGTTYYWRATDELGATASASFRTADADGVRNGFSMGVTGDWRGELSPYPAIKNAGAAGLDLFVKLGDTIYADYASPALNQPQALTLADYLAKHNEVYSPKAGLDAWGDLQKTTAILSVIDDHEVINDFAGGAAASSDPRFNTANGLINDTPLFENGLAAFNAYNAIENRTYADTGTAPRTDGEINLYRYSQQGKDAAVYVLDARSFRDAELAPVTDLTSQTQIGNFLVASANPTRTLLGAPQLAQLKADLLDAQSKGVIWKFIQLPEPIQNFGVLGAEDRYEGYSAERTDLLKFIKTNDLTGVVFISADIHGSVVNNLTYQDAPGGPQIAVAAWEITTGSVAFDAPFGQTVAGLAGAVGLLSPAQIGFYNSLPVAPDTDSVANDKDDFIKGVINQQVTALGYDPLGLNANLAVTNGLIDATLTQGDYVVTHGYGWTRFDVDATTGDLTVTTFGVPYYSAADAAANPAAIAALNPTVQAKFTVRATINETINGTAAAETLDGGAGNDTINGLAGDDTITGGYGNDSIDGGAGRDVVIFDGNRAAATIVNTGLGAWTVTTANGGTDTLKNVEVLQFADGQYGGANLNAQTNIDLSLYVRVGRYDLPEPTRTTAPANNLLAQEVSAVTYDWDTDTLFVLGDGGTSITQVSKTGALINTMTLAPGSSPQGTTFYDPEGLTYVGGGQFVMTEERDRQLVQFTYVAGGTLQRADAQTVKLGTTIGNIGFEGVSYDPQTNGFIVVKEISPQGIFQTTVDFAAGTASNGSPAATGSTNLFDPALVGTADFADVFALSNLTALQGQAAYGNILVLSQESGRIVNVDRLGNISSSLTIVSDPGNPLSVADQQHEGLTVGSDGTLYVVSENGGGSIAFPQLWVYKPSLVPNTAPTALALNNQVTSIQENTSTNTRIKVADVAITDDGLGTNTLALTGADAASFEVDSSGLYIKPGVVLDFETKPTYNVTVTVDDLTVGATPDASAPFTLNLTDVLIETPGAASIFISEVAPWSSGNSPVAADWFELTNGGATAVDITGWRFDDNSNSFAASLALNGITSIAAGESVIFLEAANLAATSTLFINTWFGGTAPGGLRFGSYSGSGGGLGTGGDAVNIYNAAGVLQANVVFGASAAGPFASFSNPTAANNATISTLSVAGTNGAFVAVNDAAEIGSPGRIANNALFFPGSPGNDTLTGGPLAETLDGGAGNDLINAGAGDDIVNGGAGNDSLDGGTGNDTVSYAGTTGNLVVTLLTQGVQQDTGAAGLDFLSDFENLTGGSGSDLLGGSATANVIDGGDGDDQLFAIGGNDTVFGGAGNDTIYGGAGNDSMAGGTGNDVYLVEDLLDVVAENAAEGSDIAFVTVNGWTQGLNVEFSYLYGSATTITGSVGDDTLIANAELASTLAGGQGNDVLWGQSSNDTLQGGAGQDVLRGQGGDDLLVGGLGNDQLVGGAGADNFGFDAPGWGYDQIFDFNRAEGDKLDFRGSGLGFANLTIVSLGGSTVVTNGADRIDVYGVPSLTSADFLFA